MPRASKSSVVQNNSKQLHKRKAGDMDDGSKNGCDSEYYDQLIPATLVKVEVEVVHDSTVDFDITDCQGPSTSRPRSKRAKRMNFSCECCGETFVTSAQWKKHKLAHQTEKRQNEKLKLKKNQKPKLKQKQEPKLKQKQQPRSTQTQDSKLNEKIMEPLKIEIEVKLEKEEFDDDSIYHTRESLDQPTLYAIINKLHAGRPISDICKFYSVTPETVKEIWEERDNFELTKPGQSFRYMASIMDSKLLDWINTQKDNGVKLNGKMVMDTAEVIAKDYGFVTFNGSRRWLDCFKKKYDISFRENIKERILSKDESIAKKEFLKKHWCRLRRGYSDEQIYTADEMGIYYNSSKGRVQKFRGKKFIHGCIEDHLAIFMCANSTGTDKRKLFVSGCEDPLIHSERNPDTLPVTYIRHSKAHITARMFNEYIKYWNRELELRNRKVLLLIDRATIHTRLKLSNINLVFIPSKAKITLMPMRNGIHNRFRLEYRRLILLDKSMNALRGIDRNLTCLEALTMLRTAWDRTPPGVINESFLKLGYDMTPLNLVDTNKSMTDEDEEMLCNSLKDYDMPLYYSDIEQLDRYISAEDETIMAQDTDNSEESKTNTHRDEILPIGTERLDATGEESAMKIARALEDLEMVRKYLQSINTNDNIYHNFLDIEKFLFKLPRIFNTCDQSQLSVLNNE